MTLRTTWDSRDLDPYEEIVNRSRSQREYRVGDAASNNYIDYLEISIRESAMWVGFTEDAALAKVLENEQPTDGGTYAWTMREENRILSSYSITRNYERKITTIAGQNDPPTMDTVVITPTPNTEVGDSFPLSITMSTTVPFAGIKYLVEEYDGATDTWQTEGWEFYNGANKVLNLNTDYLAEADQVGPFDDAHKAIRITAYSYIELLIGTFLGPEVSYTYVEPVVQAGAVTFSRASVDYTGANVFPMSVIISAPLGNRIRWRIRSYKNNGTWESWPSAFEETAQNTKSLNVNTDIIAAGAGGYHKRVEVEAYAYTVQDGVEYAGASLTRQYGWKVPSSDPSLISYGNVNNPNLVKFPYNVTVNYSTTSGVSSGYTSGRTAEYDIYGKNANTNSYTYYSSGSLSSPGNTVSVDYSSAHLGTIERSYHKVARLSVRIKITMSGDGTNYYGNWSNLDLRMPVPSITLGHVPSGNDSSTRLWDYDVYPANMTVLQQHSLNSQSINLGYTVSGISASGLRHNTNSFTVNIQYAGPYSTSNGSSITYNDHGYRIYISSGVSYRDEYWGVIGVRSYVTVSSSDGYGYYYTYIRYYPHIYSKRNY